MTLFKALGLTYLKTLPLQVRPHQLWQLEERCEEKTQTQLDNHAKCQKQDAGRTTTLWLTCVRLVDTLYEQHAKLRCSFHRTVTHGAFILILVQPGWRCSLVGTGVLEFTVTHTKSLHSQKAQDKSAAWENKRLTGKMKFFRGGSLLANESIQISKLTIGRAVNLVLPLEKINKKCMLFSKMTTATFDLIRYVLMWLSRAEDIGVAIFAPTSSNIHCICKK